MIRIADNRKSHVSTRIPSILRLQLKKYIFLRYTLLIKKITSFFQTSRILSPSSFLSLNKHMQNSELCEANRYYQRRNCILHSLLPLLDHSMYCGLENL